VTESDALIAMDEVQRPVRELPVVARSLVKELDIINDRAPEKRPVPLDALGLLRRRPRGCLAHEKIGSIEGVECGEGHPASRGERSSCWECPCHRTSFAPETTLPNHNEHDQTGTKIQQDQ
jgi:hypothetical protein